MEEETQVSLEVPVTKAVEEAVINADPIKVTYICCDCKCFFL